MFSSSLAHAVGRFAEVTQGMPDPDLDREWAWGAYDAEGMRFAFFRTYEDLRELAARTAAERLVHGPPMSTAQRILAQYHAAYRDLQAALLGIGPDDEDRAPAAEQWPLRQIVAHIIGADLGFFAVTKYALDGHRSGNWRPAKIPDEAWEPLFGEDIDLIDATLDGPLAGMRSYHEALHERIVREFAAIGEEELALPSIYWEGYEMSLRFRLHRFDSHLRQHTVQIDKTRESIGCTPNEAQRLLRLIYAALAETEGVTIGAREIGTELWQGTAETIAARTDEIAAIVT